MTKLNLGGGKSTRPGYTTLDIYPHPTVDIVCDLREGIPFPDESVDEVFSHHFIDYLDFTEVQGLMAECHRVLKNGGRVSHTIPDLQSASEVIAEHGIDGNIWMRLIFWGAMEGPNNTSIYKKSGFDHKLLRKYLEDAGFKDVRITDHGPRGNIKNFDMTAVGVK